MKTPYPFQEEAIELGVQKNLLLNDACGLGKTLTAVEIAKRYEKKGLPVLIVCPKSIRVQWYNEITSQVGYRCAAILDTDGKWKDDTLKVTKPLEPSEDWQRTDQGPLFHYMITHYENLLKFGSQLSKMKFSIIICDEAHKIKNRKARRSIWIKLLKAERKLALTATPMEKKPSDYWSIINWLYPKGTEDSPSGYFTSYWEFVNTFEEHEDITSWRQYPKFIGPKNLSLLGSVIGPFTLVRHKQDVIEDLPPRIMQRVAVPMTGNQKALYNEIATAKDMEIDLEKFADNRYEDADRYMIIKNVMSRIIRLQQVSSNPELLGYRIKSAKISWLEDFIMNNPEEKIIVFTKFRDTAIKLGGKYKAPVVIGGVKNPTVELTPFYTGKSRLVFGTIAYMGEGIDGLQVADTAVFLDQEWSTTKMNQSIDRIHRIGIDTPKHIIFVSSAQSIDNLVLKALDNKWNDYELIEQYLKEYSP